MLSNIDRVRCLVVEDDPFKMEGIRSFLKDALGDRVETAECQSLSSATSLLTTLPFSLSSGGLDVLFEIAYSGGKTPCIILTQYPDIEIEGAPVAVELAQQEILEKFDIEVAGCVRYVEGDDQWKTEVRSILERL